MFHSKVAWLLFHCSAQLHQQTEALRQLTCWVKRRQGSAKPKRKQFFSSDFMKFFEKSINSSLRCFVSGKIEEKVRPLINFTIVCLLDHSWNFYRSVHIYGILSKIKQFYRCQKSLFYSFWVSVLLSYRGFTVYTMYFWW